MAIPKQVKIGGAYYKGHILAIDSASGEYVLYMSLSSGGCAVNSISIIPQKFGDGDEISLFHMSGATGGNTVATLAENVPNMGAQVPINLDFIAMEKLAAGESIKLTYLNTASIAMDVFVLLERGR